MLSRLYLITKQKKNRVAYKYRLHLNQRLVYYNRSNTEKKTRTKKRGGT